MNKTQDLKTQITTDLEKESWVFGHGFRERGLSFWSESWFFGQNLEREKAGFSAMN